MELARRAGLDLTKASLSRKLSGARDMTTVECEALARALGIAVQAGPGSNAA